MPAVSIHLVTVSILQYREITKYGPRDLNSQIELTAI